MSSPLGLTVDAHKLPAHLRQYFQPISGCGKCYVCKLTVVFREVRRVLREDGTLWLNLGDSYAGNGQTGRNDEDRETPGGRGGSFTGGAKTRVSRGALPAKNLIGIPWRVAFALQADGWILRSDTIWHKTNAMPESVQDRPTKSHEYVFLLAKSERYFYDALAIREPHTLDERLKGRLPNFAPHQWIPDGDSFGNHNRSGGDGVGFHPLGRNKRSVWSISTTPFPDAHFAVMAPELARTCILAGSSDKACEVCGAAWERVTERGEAIQQHWKPGSQEKIDKAQGKHGITSVLNTGYIQSSYTIGFQPSCTCPGNTGAAKSIVLDPFSGAATTAYVASKLGRSYLGIELNPEYVALSHKRLSGLAAGLWGFDEEIA